MKTKVYYITPDGVEQEIHYITSDTHIGHLNIAKYAGRPYDNDGNTDAMDTDLIRLWNEVVEPNKTVLHLGDAAMGKIVNTIQQYGKMNGTKLLVPGNHDYISSHCSEKRREQYALVYAEYFTVLPEVVTLTVRRGTEDRILRASHYPSDSYDTAEGRVDKYKKLRPINDGIPLIHGHTHSKSIFYPTHPREFHVGVDAHDLKPIPADVVGDWVFSL